MKVYKPIVYFNLLVWFLLAVLGLKMLLLLKRDEIRSPHARFRHVSRSGAAPELLRNRLEPKPKLKQPHEQLELEQLLGANAHRNWSLDGDCAPYPRFEDLHIENEFYQHTRGGNVSYYLYNAYYDRRLAMERTPSVVLLGMLSSITGPFAPAYCQLWYEHSDRPELVPMQEQKIMWYESWGNGPDHVYPVLLTCPLAGVARIERVPQLVSLVFEERCARPSNALRVVYEAPQRRRAARFSICLKDLQYPDQDMSERLVEWLELMRLLGVERVVGYNLGGQTLLPNTLRTLQHYAQQNGLLQLRPFRLMEGHPVPAANAFLSKLLNEVVMYNDCFYRSLYEFDYVAVVDVDEIIMPLGQLRNWSALVERMERNCSGNEIEPNCHAWSSLCFRNMYFSRELPPDETPPASFYMLRHVRRVAQPLDANSAIKCLHATAYVTALHNHFPLAWRTACKPYDVPTSIGQLQHYREPDVVGTLREPPPVRDDNIWRFKEQLISNALVVYRELGWSLP